MCEMVEELKVPHIAFPLENLTISFGVSCLKPNLNIAPKKLLRWADLALYKAKGMGRNQAVIYNFWLSKIKTIRGKKWKNLFKLFM